MYFITFYFSKDLIWEIKYWNFYRKITIYKKQWEGLRELRGLYKSRLHCQLSWVPSSNNMSNNFLSSTQSDSYSCSSSCCLTRTLKTKRGNNNKKMHRSLITALQESPSSNYHSLPDPPSCSDNATYFSTPRNQVRFSNIMHAFMILISYLFRFFLGSWKCIYVIRD